MTRDPNSYIQASADALAETLLSKNQDYAPTGEFSNFKRSADIAGISVLQLILAQIAIKLTRIEKLMDQVGPQNEPLKDSFLDLAGYATIGHAWLETREPSSWSEFAADQWSEDGSANVTNILAKTLISDREIIRNLNDE